MKTEYSVPGVKKESFEKEEIEKSIKNSKARQLKKRPLTLVSQREVLVEE